MRVSNLLGHRNQFIVEDDNGNISFHSYNTYMAVVRNSLEDGYGKELEMKANYWSATTGKHMRVFLEETHMLNSVYDLIYKYKHFKTYKDFMERAHTVKVTNSGIITVEYKDNKGELVTYICV